MVSEMSSSELKNGIDKRWREWHELLKGDLVEIKKIFKVMLHPTAEGNDINGELRIGIKTANLIVDGLFLSLIVSVGLSDKTSSWNKVDDKYSKTVIGLSYWSGIAGERRKVREIDSQEGIEELIGKEFSDILILSKVKSSESEVYNTSLASTSTSENSLAQPSRPKLLVTNSLILQSLIRKGLIQPLRENLQRTIERNENSIKESIEKVK